MTLPNDLISEFAKLTKTDKQSSSESTVNGTIVEYNGTQYVKLDGSELLTPVKKTTSINSGERVMVMIKDHTATVIGNLSSPSVGSTDLNKVENKITDVEILVANKVSSEELDAQVARIDSLVSDNVVIRETVSANTALVNDIKAENVTITDRLTAVEAAIDDLDVTYLEADVAEITYAKITSLNATDAKLNNLQSTYATFQSTTTDRLDVIDATIDNLDSTYATITDLATERARIDVLEADKADITQLKADVADINTLMFGSATGNVLQTSFANAVIAQLGNAQIKSAMIQSLSADKITSGNIITDNVRVMSNSGTLLIRDETIQISDNTRARVQIGKDASGDYSINIWDADGNLMFSKGGITENAIKEAIIRDDMVSDTANISAYKLNIDSLFEAINGSTNTIKASKVYLDAEKQSLDIAFTTMTFDIDVLNENVSTQGTQISAVQGQIESKIWQEDIDASIYDINIGGRNLLKNSRHIQLKSNNSTDYPITSEIIAENGREFTRYRRANTTSKPTTMSLYDYIPISQITEYLPGIECTFSCLIRCSHNVRTNFMKRIEINDISYSISNEYSDYYEIGNDWRRIYTTETIEQEYDPDTDLVALRFNPFLITIPEGEIDNFYIDVCEWKIEKGNKATDWTPAPEDTIADITELNTKYSDLKQTTDSISATVASHTSELGDKADQIVVKNLIERVSTVELNQEGFETMISETYATIDDVDDLTGRVSAAESSITQNKDSITSAVKRISNNETSITNLKITDNTMISQIRTVETTANDAKTSAETANTNATNAQVAADEAQTTANAAKKQLWNQASGTSGTSGYVAFASLIIGGSYQNRPIRFSLRNRGKVASDVDIQFANAKGSDPDLSTFRENGDVGTWIVKMDTSIWYVIAKKSESYDTIYVTDYENNNANILVDWINIHYDTLPTENLNESTKLIGSAIANTIATKSELVQTNNSITAAVERISNNETTISKLQITSDSLVTRVKTVENVADDAQASAETANTNASLAQVAADEAQASADKAQESADDNNERIGQAETLIQQLSDSISVMVVDESGESLMRQDGDRWIFSMGSYNETLNKVSSGLDDLVSNVGDTQNTVKVLQQAVDDLGVLSDYIKITTYNDQPCIELGEYDSDFKLRITNTEIQFVEGTSVPAYLSNQKLYIEKAEITGELQQGGFVWSSRSNGNLGLIWKGVSS